VEYDVSLGVQAAGVGAGGPSDRGIIMNKEGSYEMGLEDKAPPSTRVFRHSPSPSSVT
jgi:hypothetical protein